MTPVPSPLAGPLLVSAALAAIAALACWRLRFPAGGFLFGFAAGFCLAEAGIAGESALLQVAGTGLLLPLLWLPLRSAPSPLSLGLRGGAALLLLLGLGLPVIGALGRPELVRPPLVGRGWEPGHALQVIGPGLRPRGFLRRGDALDRVLDTLPSTLRPRRLPLYRARQVDWWQDLRVAWQGRGKRRRVDLLVENAGPPGALEVAAGEGEVVDLPGSHKLLRLAFPPRGGTVRIRCAGALDPGGRIALLGPCGGDLERLQRLAARARRHEPTLVICFGDQVAAGDVTGLLAVREILDGLGTRVLYVPGPTEGSPTLRPVVDSLFGPRDRVALGGGATVLLLDLVGGRFDPERYPAASPFALGAAGLTPKLLALNATLTGPAGGPGTVEPGSIGTLRDRARQAGVGLVVGPIPGAGYHHAAGPLPQLALGFGPDGTELVVLERSEAGFGAPRRETVPAEGGLSGAWTALVLRARGLARERPGWFRRLLLVGLGVPLVLAALLREGRRLKRRRRDHDPES